MASPARRVHRTFSLVFPHSSSSALRDVTQLGSFCLSEPVSGSDAFALQTRAVKDGDHWVINGTKMWITNSYEADFFLIFANVSAKCHLLTPT